MAVMNLYEPDAGKNILRELREQKNCPAMLIMIVWFVFLPMVQSLMKELDDKFNGKAGNEAYPRTALLIATLYCFSLNIDQYSKMQAKCNSDDYLKIAIRNIRPSRGTFSNFLNKSDERVMDKVFASTLVIINDSGLLKLIKLFLDGTDLIVRASIRFTINAKEVKVMRLLGNWDLIHDSSEKSILHTEYVLNEKLKSLMYMGETEELIKLALKRIKIYNTRNYQKLHKYEAILSNRGVNKCSIIFPSAVYMMTKKKSMDFAFNLQEFINQDHIIISGLLLKQPNDEKAFKPAYEKLEKTMNDFYHLQNVFGERNNGDGFKDKLLKAIFVADAGYFTNVNLYYILQKGINAVIMPKIIATFINNEFREKSDKNNKNKSNKVKYERVLNGYLCLDKRFMKLIGSFFTKKRKEEKIELTYLPISSCSMYNWHRIYEIPKIPDILREKTFIFKRTHCNGCKLKSECFHNPLKIKTTELLMNATEKYLKLRYRKIYSLRLSRSESINGYYKGSDGIYKLVGTTETAVNNEVNLKNALYNLIRYTNLRGITFKSVLYAIPDPYETES